MLWIVIIIAEHYYYFARFLCFFLYLCTYTWPSCLSTFLIVLLLLLIGEVTVE